MIRPILISIASIFILFIHSVQGDDRSRMLLAGPVKSVTVYEFEARGKAESPIKGRAVALPGTNYNFSLFDEKGMLVEQRSQLNDSTVLASRLLSYSKDSLQSEKISGADGLETIVYERDRKGRVTAIRHSNKQGPVKGYRYIYDDKEHSVTWQVLNGRDTLNKFIATPQNVYHLNESGMPVSVDHYTFSNPTTMIKATKSVWSYNDQGMVSKYIDFFKNDSIKADNSWYYSKGMHADSLITTEYLFSRAPKSKTSIYFDDKGNIIRKTEYVFETRLTSVLDYRYEFDDKGNWTKKVTLQNGRPVNIAERKIEYFPEQKP